MLAFLFVGTLIAQDAKVTPLMSKDLADFPGKEGQMITVTYPPGATDPLHRHNAHAFLYVLEGSVDNAGQRREGSHADARTDFL